MDNDASLELLRALTREQIANQKRILELAQTHYDLLVDVIEAIRREKD